MVTHGFYANLLPEGRLTNLETYIDTLRSGIAGEVDEHYNQAMFDKERDL